MSVLRLRSLFVSLLVAGAALGAGCMPPASLDAESVASSSQGLASAGLYAASYDRIWRKGSVSPGSGNDWTYASEAASVSAITMHGGDLLATSYGNLWRCDALGSPSTPALAQFTKVGEAYDVVALASFKGNLIAAADNALWMRGAIGPGTGNDWSYVGDAYNVTAMVAHNNYLYVTSNNALWQRVVLGPGSGNSWTYAGDAYNVTAMVSYGGYLYAASGGSLWRRGAIGPGTGNDWTYIGPAANIASLAAISAANNLAAASAWTAGATLQTGMKLGILGDSGWIYQGGWTTTGFTPSFVAIRNAQLSDNGRTWYSAPVLEAASSLLAPDNTFTVTVLPPIAGETLAGETRPFQKILLQAPGGSYVGTHASILWTDVGLSDAHVFIYFPSENALSDVGYTYGNLTNNGWLGYSPRAAQVCFSVQSGFPTYYTTQQGLGWPQFSGTGCLVTLYLLQ